MNSLGGKRIFIVDDDPFWMAILREILSAQGYKEILEYSNGSECVAHLHLNPSLVFLDYQMDDMNGLEVLQKIKDHYPGISVIFCTAYEDLNVAMKAIENGSFDYLLKSNANLKSVSSIIESISKNQELTLTQ